MRKRHPLNASIIFLCLIISSIFTSCVKEPEEVYSIYEKLEDNKNIEYTKKVFSENGCVYPEDKDISKIELIHIIKFNEDKYFYGSIENEGEKAFWVTKFTKDGSFIWETIISPTDNSCFAKNPILLSNNDLLFSMVYFNYDILSQFIQINPVIIKSQDGKAIEVKGKRQTAFDQVFLYDEWFICKASSPLSISTGLSDWEMQISNDGKILNESESLPVPEDNKDLIASKWKDANSFVCVTKNDIKRFNLNENNSTPIWSYNHQISKDASDLAIDFSNDWTTITYKSPMNDEEIIDLLYETGEPIGIKFSEKKIQLLLGESQNTEIMFSGLPNTTKVNYISGDPSIVYVNENGVIKGLAKGKTNLTICTEDGRHKDECQIEVIHFTDKITLITSGSIINVGGYVTASLNLMLMNKCGKDIYVKQLIVTDGFRKEIYNGEIKTNLKSGDSLSKGLSLQNVYKPTYKYTYTVDGEDYEVTKTEQ